MAIGAFSYRGIINPAFTNAGASQIQNGTTVGGTVTLNVALGYSQKLTNGAAFTLALTGWDRPGFLSTIELELVNGGAFTITWPTVNWCKGDGTTSTTFADMNVTLATSGTNTVWIWTTVGGTTLYGRAL